MLDPKKILDDFLGSNIPGVVHRFATRPAKRRPLVNTIRSPLARSLRFFAPALAVRWLAVP